jgi:hypothetical protein
MTTPSNRSSRKRIGAAKEFNIEDTKKLIAVQRQTARHAG